ncbi:hypothetical protein [Pseudonocardia sp. NPDC049635]|uniref:hypothetical protein n=1 Tax=Pseudonocardia sp. NPDC049635 TaxID=3155506 RepID=UPI00340E791F
MSTVAGGRPAADQTLPLVVAVSVALWLGAILSGVVESLVRLAGPAAPTVVELVAGAAVHLVLAVFVLQLCTGREAVRWTVAGLFGVVGMWWLVAEPLRALLGGATVAGFLAAASGPELLAAGLRSLHVAEVLGALALLFRPASNEFFRSGRDGWGRPGRTAPGAGPTAPAGPVPPGRTIGG